MQPDEIGFGQNVEGIVRHINMDFVIAAIVVSAALALDNRLLIVVGAVGMIFAAMRIAVNYLRTSNA